MKQIELTSKLLLAIIALTSVSAILVPTYAAPRITSADIVDGTIQSVDIKNGEVKNADLANDAVTTGKIADGTIQEQDIADGVIPTGDTQLNTHIVEGPQETLTIAQPAVSEADCPPGEILTGGGFSADFDVHIRANFPSDENTWRVVGQTESSDQEILKGWAICLTPSP
jgi:hypothetical protein